MMKQTLLLILSKSASIIFAFLNSLFILYIVNDHLRGYYFTFLSIGAFSLMFELGIGTVIGQFLSHETAFFTVKSLKFEGKEEHINRFFQIIRSAIQWYSKILSFGFLVLFTAGFILFTSKGNQVSDWILPWGLYLISILSNILLEILFSSLYTLGEIKSIQIIKIISVVFSYAISWLGIKLFPSNQLLFMVITPGIILIINSIVIFLKYRNFILKIIDTKISNFSWNNEILNLQKKMALSYISGAFIYNIFTPSAFYFFGNELAARVGITLQFANATSGVLNYVVGVQSLGLGKLFAQSKINETLQSVKRMSIITCGFSVLGMIILIVVYFLGFSKKLLPLPEVLFFSLSSLINTQVFIFASYIRAQKKEEFVNFSVMFAILTASLVPTSMYLWGSFGQSFTFLILNIFYSLPYGYFLFSQNFQRLKLQV
jgi:hypothetical protein